MFDRPIATASGKRERERERESRDRERADVQIRIKRKRSEVLPAKLCQSSRRIADEETNWEKGKHVRFRFESFFHFTLAPFFLPPCLPPPSPSFFCNIRQHSSPSLGVTSSVEAVAVRSVRPWHLFSLSISTNRRVARCRRKSTCCCPTSARCEIRLRGSVQLALTRIHSPGPRVHGRRCLLAAICERDRATIEEQGGGKKGGMAAARHSSTKRTGQAG